MLRYLVDPANAMTATGIVISSTAVYAALVGHVELATAFGLWAMLADQFDGIIAKRTRHRPEDVGKIGKSLDGFSDIIYGAVLPTIILMTIADYSIVTLVLGAALLLAGALRLSYFSNFGLCGGAFTGLPLSYDLPIMAILLLARPHIGDSAFTPLVLCLFGVLACLHVAPVRVPAPRGIMYVGITAFCLAASITLIQRGLQ
ncbi:CDP-alcohol phosphatidyltransferase family protein [Bradyrhizobium sp. UFLA01-814]|uniref:CDP-alcohol phosphatidyltransferase family protein n=1 Tax=Bradyrhizobium sp. UFLA01-814 TaxID=3023480 RepID=UPI00398B93FE